MDAARVVFERHAAGPEMDGRQFAKLLKMADMYDRAFKTTDSDLIFAKVKPANQRKIDWLGFEDAMEEVALRRRVDFNTVMDMVAGAGTKPLFQPAPRTKSTSGPERFYYDKNTYTGVHTRGGPSTQDGGMVTFERAVKRTAPRSKNPAPPGDEVRRTCPRCMFSWLDKYRKDECPKCSAYIQPPRRASEVARELLQGTAVPLDDASPSGGWSVKSRAGGGRARTSISPQREAVRRQRDEWARNNPDSPYRRSVHSYDDGDETMASLPRGDRGDGDRYDPRGDYGDTYDARGRDAYAYDEPHDGGPSAYPPESPYDPRDHDTTQQFDSRFALDVDSPNMSRTMAETPPRSYGAERNNPSADTGKRYGHSPTRRAGSSPATRRADDAYTPATRRADSPSGAATCKSTGPARFFYDKNSYTGTHQKGGPTTMGSGASLGIMGTPKQRGSVPTAADYTAILGRDPRKAAPNRQKPRQVGEEVRMRCPTCCHKWVDKYGKNECPKCLSRLW